MTNKIIDINGLNIMYKEDDNQKISIMIIQIKENENRDDIVIPGKINGKEVWRIGKCAGYREFVNNKKLILPNSINTIEDSAFYGCDGLEIIEVPKNLKFIGSYAFWGCSKVRELKFNKLNIIQKEAFRECSSLETIRFNSKVMTIESHAFLGCDNLKNMYFSHDIENIEELAFQAYGDIIIHGPKNSNLEKYCNKHKITFQEYETLNTILASCRNISKGGVEI